MRISLQHEIVSDVELDRAFNGTNFGSTSNRTMLNQALIKTALLGNPGGYTIRQILRNLRLTLKDNCKSGRIRLSAKGYDYVVALHFCFDYLSDLEKQVEEA